MESQMASMDNVGVGLHGNFLGQLLKVGMAECEVGICVYTKGL